VKAIWRILKVIGAVAVGFAAVKEHLDKLMEFLTFFADNKHAEGYLWLRDSEHVRPLYDALTAEKQANIDEFGPMLLEWIDVVLPEEPILAFLQRIKNAIG